ncbi:MAG: hypothetical protein ACXVEF_23895 [Polyangiales bacterium]
MSLLLLLTAACDGPASPHATSVQGELRSLAADVAVEDEDAIVDATFPVVGTLEGVPFEEATAYVHVTRKGDIVGLDVLGDRIAGCDDRSKWVTHRGAFLLDRAGGSSPWKARIYGYDDELPCPGGTDHSFGLAGGHASVTFDDVRGSVLVADSFVEGRIELATGKGAHPSATLVARFRARVCID